ncbi:MAG: hypothetical protein JXB15_11590 [Anaerolineales bacterium]|nr:hypothetical protein [Anaerolineales bacterium]
MKASKLWFVLVISLALGGLFLAGSNQAALAAAPSAKGVYAPAYEHAVAAMSEIVARYGSLDKVTDPGDASAYRYLAMADFYESYQLAISSTQSAQNAIVAKYGSLDKVTDSGDAMAYRYLALAASYER